MKRTALYRHFGADGELLYVGIAASPMSRTAQHVASEWADQVASITFEWHESRTAALNAETRAVLTEAPLHNRTKRPIAAKAVQDFHGELFSEINAFCAARGMLATTFGKLAVNDKSLVSNIADGRELRWKTVQRVRNFMMEAV